jgi:amino acid adenylation domain-containing protein
MDYLNRFLPLANTFDEHQSGMPLSPEQYAIWLEQELYPSDISNHAHFVANINDGLDAEAFKQALQGLSKRHESLRTVFPIVNDIPLRRVLPADRVDLQLISCSNYREEEVLRLIDAEFRRPFKLSVECPYRFRLYIISDASYYLQIIQHQICTAISYAVLVDELITAYALERSGGASYHTTKGKTYSQFVARLWNDLRTGSLSSSKEYWDGYLLGSLPKIGLPMAEPAATLSEFEPCVVHFDIEKGLVEGLRSVCERTGSTFFALIVAAYSVLLFRYVKSNEIVIGIPSDMRKALELKGEFDQIIGYTTNTLPLRVKFEKGKLFSSLLKQIRHDLDQLKQNRLYPCTQIRMDKQNECQGAGQRLFDVLAISQRFGAHKEIGSFGVGRRGVELEIAGIKLTSIGIGVLNAGRFDLSLASVQTSEGEVISIHYNAQVLDDGVVQSFGRNLLCLLRQVAQDLDKPLQNLKYISDNEMALINSGLAALNEGEKIEPFLKRFQKISAEESHSQALHYKEQIASYGELSTCADKLASYLVESGVRPNTRVGLAVSRTPKMLVAIIAIMKCGATFVPIDVSLPGKRVDFMMQDSEISLVLADQGTFRRINSQVGCINLDTCWNAMLVRTNFATKKELEYAPERIAYILYTSGSTGQPKGVAVSYGSLDNLLASFQDLLQISAGHRWLALTTISFDISLLELLLPLRQGAAVVLADRNEATDPALLIDIMDRYSVTHMQATPTTWQMVLGAGWLGKSELVALTGGEALSLSLGKRLLSVVGELWNVYGPTETTIWSSAIKLKAPLNKITIGRPIANTTFYILDEEQSVVPIGVPGELYIGGAGVAYGYVGAAASASSGFVTLPIPCDSLARFYRTGDLARLLPTGEVEYIGRRDSQVKLHGYRIELGEVEELACSCPGVERAVATVKKSESSLQYLVLYYIGIAKEDLVRRELTHLLPTYMVPNQIMHLKSFPISSSGKIDRTQLPTIACRNLSENYIAPHDQFEDQIIKVFELVLGAKGIGVRDNFFALGGHSFAAARAVSAINECFYITLPIKDLFANPSAECLALKVRQALRGANDRQLIKKAPAVRAIPLTPSQQQFLTFEQWHEGSVNYTIPMLVNFVGPLNTEALVKALTRIVERHAILRSYIAHKDGIFIQKVKGYSTPLVDVIDLVGDSGHETLSNRIDDVVSRPFDLFKGPLYRFVLLKSGEEANRLIIQFHHVIFDGCSVDIFLTELESLYGSYHAGVEEALNTAEIQFSDYAYWLSRLDRAQNGQDLLWWSKKLRGASGYLSLPTDAPRPSILSSNGSVLETRLLSRFELSELTRIAMDGGTTLFAALLAAFHVFLYKYAGENDMVIGVPVSGRTLGQLDKLIGCFVNTLPIQISSNSSDSFTELLSLVNYELLNAFEHQEVTVSQIVEQLSNPTQSRYSPLYQVIFNSLPESCTKTIGDLEFSVIPIDRHCSHVDLSVTTQERDDGLYGYFEYSTEIFSARTVERMAAHFRDLIKNIIQDPSTSILHLSVLSSEELHRQIDEWNPPLCTSSGSLSLVQMFEKRVLETPDAVAVVCGGSQLTFAELNIAANQIAWGLLNRGVTSNDRVAIQADRSVSFLAYVLGTLKSGAAYVPLDPFEPLERAKIILNEVQPFAILGHYPFNCPDLKCEYLSLMEVSNESQFNPSLSCGLTQLAYIVFTSGSTGKPKGVEIEHHCLLDRLCWKMDEYPLAPSDTVLHLYSLAFDASILNYFWPLCAGAKLVLSTREEQYDSMALVSLIKDHTVSIVDLLPSQLLGLLECDSFKCCSSLRVVFSGGEPLKGELVRLFYSRSAARLVNTYGPTEATVECSVFECSLADCNYPIVPIGRPIAGATMYILDKDSNVVPIGVPGELFIGGKGLARGYLNQPSLTQERFMTCCLGEGIVQRLYRTGDRARYQPDGTIEFLGRLDKQVKIRGFRVEIGEIEQYLLQMKGIENVLVAVQGEDLDRYLVAYLILKEPESEESLMQRIRAHLGDKLSPYMIPQRAVVMDRFPTLPNGKIHHNGLPVPASLAMPESYLMATHLEARLHEHWCEVLHREGLSRDDNFFEVGGNSLLAMRLVNRINVELGCEIPLSYIFQCPTIASLAKKLQENNSGLEKWSPLIRICKGGGDRPLFMIHPIGGGVLCYSALAKNWDLDRPLYGIQAKGLEKGQRPLRSIKAMASYYIKEIKKVQAAGPYLIGGWSFGGIIGAEIVHHLSMMGESVEGLMVFDTLANIDSFKDLDIEDDAHLLSTLTRHYPDASESFQEDRSIKDRLAALIEGRRGELVPKMELSVARVVSLARAHSRALQRYTMPIIRTNVALVRSQLNPDKEYDLGWGRYADDVSVYLCAGDHWAITNDVGACRYIEAVRSFLATQPEAAIND